MLIAHTDSESLVCVGNQAVDICNVWQSVWERLKSVTIVSRQLWTRWPNRAIESFLSFLIESGCQQVEGVAHSTSEPPLKKQKNDTVTRQTQIFSLITRRLPSYVPIPCDWAITQTFCSCFSLSCVWICVLQGSEPQHYIISLSANQWAQPF